MSVFDGDDNLQRYSFRAQRNSQAAAGQRVNDSYQHASYARGDQNRTPQVSAHGGDAARTPAAQAMYIISVAAQLAGMHPQTLRQYDKLGLVTPERTRGRGRRYSPDDIDLLRTIQRLSHEEGINLAGISRIIELTRQVHELKRENQQLSIKVDAYEARAHRVFAADRQGDVQTLRRGRRASARRGASVGNDTTKELVLRGAYQRALIVYAP